MTGCVKARGRTHSKVVLSRPLQQPYTPLGSRVFTYVFRSFTKKSNDSLVGQRQSFVVVQQAYDTSMPRPMRHVRDRVQVERERVRSGRLGGVPPQRAHQGESVAGLDAPHVRKDHGRDIQVGIEDRTVRIGYPHAALGRHGGDTKVKCGASWLQSWLFPFLVGPGIEVSAFSPSTKLARPAGARHFFDAPDRARPTRTRTDRPGARHHGQA